MLHRGPSHRLRAGLLTAALMLAVAIAPAHALTPDDPPGDPEGVGKVAQYLACAVSVFVAPTPATFGAALLQCVRLLLHEPAAGGE